MGIVQLGCHRSPQVRSPGYRGAGPRAGPGGVGRRHRVVAGAQRARLRARRGRPTQAENASRPPPCTVDGATRARGWPRGRRRDRSLLLLLLLLRPGRRPAGLAQVAGVVDQDVLALIVERVRVVRVARVLAGDGLGRVRVDVRVIAVEETTVDGAQEGVRQRLGSSDSSEGRGVDLLHGHPHDLVLAHTGSLVEWLRSMSWVWLSRVNLRTPSAVAASTPDRRTR
jgi:hypothetical protein